MAFRPTLLPVKKEPANQPPVRQTGQVNAGVRRRQNVAEHHAHEVAGNATVLQDDANRLGGLDVRKTQRNRSHHGRTVTDRPAVRGSSTDMCAQWNKDYRSQPRVMRTAHHRSEPQPVLDCSEAKSLLRFCGVLRICLAPKCVSPLELNQISPCLVAWGISSLDRLLLCWAVVVCYMWRFCW